MKYLKSKILNFPNIKHAFSLRVDGVSPKPWDSLNCSYFVGDNEKNVKINRKKVLNNLGFKKSFYINQVHGGKVVNAAYHYNKNKIIGIKITSGVIGKKELSIKDTNARNHLAFGFRAFDIVQLYNKLIYFIV